MQSVSDNNLQIGVQFVALLVDKEKFISVRFQECRVESKTSTKKGLY
jgi:hypothetical protein